MREAGMGIRSDWRERLAAVGHLYVFGAPGRVGGAATKIRDLVGLLKGHVPMTVVVATVELRDDPTVREFARRSGVPVILRKDLPARASGVACVVCEPDLFTSGWAERIRDRGLRLVFSNDMMWAFPGEREAARGGWIDRVLFVSEGQRRQFEAIHAGVDQVVVPNFIDPEGFPWVERSHARFTIGRLSRPDPAKFPVDFPVFYEALGLEGARFRVQAWTEEVGRAYRWHRFGSEWELLAPNKVPAARFLQSLDLFLYPLGHRVVESWGRAVVEAMLTGCVVVVPTGHSFHEFVEPGRTGFLFGSFGECREIVRALHRDGRLRAQVGRAAAEAARHDLCHRERHLTAWAGALTFES